MAKVKADSYANVAAVLVTESGTATLTTTKFQFPFSIMDKMALIINRAEYWLNSTDKLDTTGDSFVMGICAASTLTDPSAQSDPLIIDSVAIERRDLGTAATGFFWKRPFLQDFSSLPGGGILVAPAPLYGFLKGYATSAAGNAWIKFYYTYVELATDEYWQLVESRRIITS